MSDVAEEKMFSITLSGDGMSFDRKITQQVALQVMNVVLGTGFNQPGVAHTPLHRPVGDVPEASLPLSLREFLDKIGASKKPDQITTIAQYIIDHEKQEDFGREDIRSRFLTAREPLPGNFGRDFAVALKNGWLAEVHGKKNRFYVTTKGIQAINNNFSNGKSSAARR
jgi:hypothetical protein